MAGERAATAAATVAAAAVVELRQAVFPQAAHVSVL